MVGQAMLPADSSGFLIKVVNEGTVDVTVNSLVFSDTSEFLYMRDFVVEADHGTGYPIPNGMPGTGPGDTVKLQEPVTIAPDMSQMVELYFADFHVDSLGAGERANVSGKVFVFRFNDGSVITVKL
jgi:hypothetical protein